MITPVVGGVVVGVGDSVGEGDGDGPGVGVDVCVGVRVAVGGVPDGVATVGGAAARGSSLTTIGA
jgi:hypothetical protein